MSNARVLQQSSIIFSQLTTYTKMACGARDYVSSKSASGYGVLRFKVNDGKMREYVRIELTPLDLYTIEHFKLKRVTNELVILNVANNIYCDQLNEIIYDMTQRAGSYDNA